MADESRISRRRFLEGAAAGAALTAGVGMNGVASAAPEAGAAAQLGTDGSSASVPVRPGSQEWALTNGVFVDARGVVANAITIQDGRIVDVGKGRALGPSTRTVNLKGRMVVPGLIDSHAHFTRTGTNPGYETRWIETTTSIAELQAAVAARAQTVPEGPDRFITAAGGWNQNQFAEGRLPTLAELDAATSRHGVYLNGRTNSVGKAFFEARGITVDETTGQVSSTAAATTALRAIHTFEDKLRGTADLIAFAAATGLTMIHDTSNLTVQPDDYAVMNALYRDSGRSLDVRMRHYRYFGTTTPDFVKYMDPIFREVGDGTYRINGVGEVIGGPNDFVENLRAAARAGWRVTQHTLSVADHTRHFDGMVQVGQEFDISELRWSLAHVTQATEAQLSALKAVGAGVTVQDFSGTGAGRGAPFRRIVDSGIPVGGGTDSTNVAPLNPWLSLFYMVSGRNFSHAGTLTNDGQQITRLEALRLYTTGSAWFSNEDNDVGSFEVGKLADLAVLSDDYLAVREDQIKKITSLLTLQGGRVVHAVAPFAELGMA